MDSSSSRLLFKRGPSARYLALAGSFALLVLAAATPAQADYCIRLSGGSFSGDLGFFRFQGTRPTAAGVMQTVRGRVAGLGPFSGSAIVTKNGKTLEIGATFFVDASEGQFDISFSPPGARTGGGYANYGAYDVNQSVVAKSVSCANEP
jgi:hypothetical protein